MNIEKTSSNPTHEIIFSAYRWLEVESRSFIKHRKMKSLPLQWFSRSHCHAAEK